MNPLSSAQSSALKRRAFPPSALWEKNVLRPLMRDMRASQDPRAIRYKNQKIASAVLSLPEIQAAQCVAAYASLPTEAGTDEMISSLLDQKKHVVLPRVNGNNLELYRIRDLRDDLAPQGAFSIREPIPNRCERISPSSVDLFLIPGVAFDPFGSRLGFGAGYYDRLLSLRRQDAAAAALAFEFQVVHALETTERDIPADLVVTEESIYELTLSAFTSASEEETRKLAQRLLENGLRNGGLIAIHGGLGTGKTVFVQGLAAALGAKGQAVSPTFVFCREYRAAVPLFHADCYRIEAISPEDEEFWRETINQPGIVAVEWAERLGALIPKNAIHLFGDLRDDGKREWTLATVLRDQKSLHKV
ncbi:MAG: 5-formyltetrahydrofolate cyclo-ligase [Candidatus Omnitrophota bacterium]